MSYYHPAQNNYTQGWDDMYIVVFWIVALTGIRVAVMDYILKPIAQYGGIYSKKSQTRFAEQGWLCVYASFFWSLGMVGAISHITHGLGYGQARPYLLDPGSFN
jgi:very-long-chain ceramide synthase